MLKRPQNPLWRYGGLLLVVAAVVLITFFLTRGNYARLIQPQSDQTILRINGIEIAVVVADTDELRHRGLSGRASLDENAGMLFIFAMPGEYPFWMKDMQFSIDIIWIDAERKIIAISEHVAPETYPASFSPSDPVQYVLEATAGWAERNGIEVGEKIEF